MRIFFDVDYTILSVDRLLRPGTELLFGRLVADGHAVYVWSGSGHDWARGVVDGHGLTSLVSGVFAKPDPPYAERLLEFGVDVVPEFVVDDHRAVVEDLGGYQIRIYYYADRRATGPDPELDRVYEAVTAAVGKT